MRRVLPALGAIAGLVATATALAAGSGSSGVWDFVSAPNLHPPKLRVLVQKPGLAPGYFLANAKEKSAGPGETAPQSGALLMDSVAQPVWFLPLSEAFNLQQETYMGKPVLVVYNTPAHNLGQGYGPRQQAGSPSVSKVLIYDEHYRRIATIRAHAPWAADLHDAWIIGGDIWITVVREVKHQNLTRYGGPRDGSVADMGLQEFQVSTGRLIRTWDALNPRGKAQIPLSESHQGVGASGNWDAYHTNSVQALPDGDLVVSMRNTWSVYLIDPVTDRVLWTLGGRGSSFQVPHDAHFVWQHDARLENASSNGRGRAVKLTLFDNNSNRGPARAMILRLNTVTRRAKLIAAYSHHPPAASTAMGSIQVLPNGNALVDWGAGYAYFSEFSKAGKELLNVAWPSGRQSYRTLLTDDWAGTPYYPPSGAVRGTTAYASWNGATQVARWEVLAGSSPSELQVVATGTRTGFETAIKLGATYGVYEVRALDSEGHTLGTSKAFS